MVNPNGKSLPEGKKARHQEDVLDEAIDETFPASDPISPDSGKHPTRRKKPSREDSVEHKLDEALDDTFPASDPVSINSPHRKA